MEILLFILLVVVILIFLAKNNFFAKKKEKIVERSGLIDEIIKKIEPKEEPRKVDIFYEMNTHQIKLNLYPVSNFQNYRMRNLYSKIVVNTYWIEEPFHSSFVNILYYIESHDFWIKSPNTQEIIMNIRGPNAEELQETALYVLDLKEVLSDIVLEIFNDTYTILCKEYTQITLLTSIVYTLSKSENIHIFTYKYNDEIELWSFMIQMFFNEFSQENKIDIIPINNLNFKIIEQIYLRTIDGANEYANYKSNNIEGNQNLISLDNLEKKRLLRLDLY